MATFKVTIQSTTGPDVTFNCPDDQYILDGAHQSGHSLPYSCRAGACSACACKLVSGLVDNSEQSYLDDEQMEDGWILSCVAYPVSDCVIQVLPLPTRG